MIFNRGEGGRNFFQVPKPDMGGKVQNFSNSQSLYRGRKTSIIMSLRVECSRFVFGEVAAVSLQGKFGTYMEETEK